MGVLFNFTGVLADVAVLEPCSRLKTRARCSLEAVQGLAQHHMIHEEGPKVPQAETWRELLESIHVKASQAMTPCIYELALNMYASVWATADMFRRAIPRILAQEK